MGDLTLNPNLVAKAYDTNKDGKVSDNLNISKDTRTINALGGDSDVTVEELANALSNDSVIVQNGTVISTNGSVRIPNLFGDAKQVNEMASNALFKTSSWNLTYPVKPDPEDYYYISQETGKHSYIIFV